MGFKVTGDGREEHPQEEGRHLFPRRGSPLRWGAAGRIKGRDGVTAEPEGCHPAEAGSEGAKSSGARTLEVGGGGQLGWGETRGGNGAEGDCHADPWRLEGPSLRSCSTPAAGATQNKGR